MIVKVQRPLASSFELSESPWLVYDQKRKYQNYFMPSPHLVEAMNGDAKAYFAAAWSTRERRWVFDKRVEEQDW